MCVRINIKRAGLLHSRFKGSDGPASECVFSSYVSNFRTLGDIGLARAATFAYECVAYPRLTMSHTRTLQFRSQRGRFVLGIYSDDGTFREHRPSKTRQEKIFFEFVLKLPFDRMRMLILKMIITHLFLVFVFNKLNTY